MSESVYLVGFIADLPGTDEHFVLADPVVLIGDSLYAARGLDWSRETLTQVSVGDERYVHFVRSADKIEIQVGDSVWLAGNRFLDNVKAIGSMLDISLTLGGWKLAVRGVRWRTGSSRAFREFSDRLFHHAEAALHSYLFDPLEKAHDGDLAANHVLRVLDVSEKSRQLLDQGLYFFEKRDLYSLEFVRAEAVEMGYWPDLKSFDFALAQLRETLRTERLSELAPSNFRYRPNSDFWSPSTNTTAQAFINQSMKFWVQLGRDDRPSLPAFDSLTHKIGVSDA